MKASHPRQRGSQKLLRSSQKGSRCRQLQRAGGEKYLQKQPQLQVLTGFEEALSDLEVMDVPYTVNLGIHMAHDDNVSTRSGWHSMLVLGPFDRFCAHSVIPFDP